MRLELKTNNGITELMKAASSGDLNSVQALIAQGADLNAKDIFGRTALMYAVGAESADVTRVLLYNGADVQAQMPGGVTALNLAERKGSSDLLQLVKNAQLSFAARDGDMQSVNDLLADGADVNTSIKDGWTTLMIAVVNEHTEVVEALLNHDADVNAVTDNGWTALRIAIRKGDHEIIRLLKLAGAKDWSTDTPGEGV